MEVYNALQLKNGAKVEGYNQSSHFTQPIQFLPQDKKDQEWAMWNMDWLELQGLKQIRANAKKMMKNYKLAEGIIDKSDYIPEEDNDYSDILETLSDVENPFELEFYPILPNIIKTLTAEFAKRNKRITYRAVDEASFNELLEAKRSDIETSLIAKAEQKLMAKLAAAGLEPDSEEFQKTMSPENIKSLPEIQEFYTKSYINIPEQWASKQHDIDEERFHMDELEERAFYDFLINYKEYWHFDMLEDDYNVELWNPVLTFEHKSPENKYTSDSSFAGNVELLTLSDVIDKYGWKMNQLQLESLEKQMPASNVDYAITGYANDGARYDATKSHEWNSTGPSLGYRQYMSMMTNFVDNGNDVVDWIMGDGQFSSMGESQLFRVTKSYWKSQRKIGHLTKIDLDGEVTTSIIDESYQIVDKPIYNNVLFKNNTEDNLIFGEHVEWVWINQTWGGIKIGPNMPTWYGNKEGITPIYIGINQNEIKPLKFQFKGNNSIYGCKIPVEGLSGQNRYISQQSLIDLGKPFQIAYNMVNNQMKDILIDEIGTVLLFDQNTLPQHSMGEDWGKGNLAKAYVAMKDFSMLPLDTSITNTENALNFQHFQTLNMEQTGRLMSRIQLANYFKQQAYEAVGLNPQRMGQQIGQTNTATGVEQAVAGSYAQTETFFIQHSDYLMPRVHQMRTDLAQYYASTKPSLRIQYTTSADERVFFEINTTDLLLRDLNVYGTTNANHRQTMEQIRQMAVQNNTTGATIYDLGALLSANSLGSIQNVLKGIDQKSQKRVEEERAHAEKLKGMELQQRDKEIQMANDTKAAETEKLIRKDLMVAEIKASGYASSQDINQNKESDYTDAMNDLKKSEQYQESMGLSREKEVVKQQMHSDKLSLEKEKLNQARELKEKDLQIAKENKNRFDVKNDKKK